MEGDLDTLRAGFASRVRTPRLLVRLLAGVGRTRLAFAMAFAPAAALLIVALLPGFDAFLRHLTTPENVQPTFSRAISGVATASSIAVSVALLAMGREMRGISDTQEALHANRDFRDRLREALKVDELPVLLPDLIVSALEGLVDRAEAARRTIAPGEAPALDGWELDEILDALAANARMAARGVWENRAHPDRVHVAFLDHEPLLHAATLRRFLRRAALSDATREALEALQRLHDEVVILQRYAKTLDYQWGLSRMSRSVLIAAFPAVVLATWIALGYGRAFVDLWGVTAAAVLVCVSAGVVLLPLALFVSHLLRFITLTRFTLSTEAVALGPDEASLLRGSNGR